LGVGEEIVGGCLRGRLLRTCGVGENTEDKWRLLGQRAGWKRKKKTHASLPVLIWLVIIAWD